MNSFISSDNTWMLWTFLVVWSAISIVLEQKYKWASKVTGAIIALLGAIIFANLKIIPTESSVYDSVWTYVVPVAIPLLLLKADIKKVKNESGKMLGAFHVSALGTVAGTFISAFLLSSLIPHIAEIAGMMTGSYIGGGANFVAILYMIHVWTYVVKKQLQIQVYLIYLLFSRYKKVKNRKWKNVSNNDNFMYQFSKQLGTVANRYIFISAFFSS